MRCFMWETKRFDLHKQRKHGEAKAKQVNREGKAPYVTYVAKFASLLHI